MTHYDVLIATPGAKFEAQYVDSLVKTLNACSEQGITYRWLNGYSSLVHHARELTASGLGGTNLDPDQKSPGGDLDTYNKIIWIDSDIQWAPEQFFKLYNSKLDIVSGAYLISNGVTSTIHTPKYPGGMPKNTVLTTKDTIKVDAVGFGFIAVASGVFEKMNRPWFTHYQQQMLNSRNEVLIDSVGEDISWCMNARNAGFDIYFDPSVLVNHVKTTPITWA
jgi:hypothetical protein